jgi:hypothetical protein
MEGSEEPPSEVPAYDVNLEAGELFTQLCAVTNLLKVGPIKGLFLSIVNVADGVIRVWREWLREQAERSGTEQPREGQKSLEESGILWTDSSKDVGVRFRVLPKEDSRAPLLIGPNDEPPISYTLEYQG